MRIETSTNPPTYEPQPLLISFKIDLAVSIRTWKQLNQKHKNLKIGKNMGVQAILIKKLRAQEQITPNLNLAYFKSDPDVGQKVA